MKRKEFLVSSALGAVALGTGSYQMDQSWEEVLLSMDGIVVSGGNTLNQQAIWRVQGIDEVLREAWDRGIVLGGASAGSLYVDLVGGRISEGRLEAELIG